MFPRARDLPPPATRSWRATVRQAADLIIAFMTLESYGLGDLRPSRSESPGEHSGFPADDTAACPASPGYDEAAAGLEHAHDLQHRHRQELRAPHRPRRPGTSAPREQFCSTPVGSTSAGGPPAPATSTSPGTAGSSAPSGA